jgi:NADH-quinone oxidoreductase subunit N
VGFEWSDVGYFWPELIMALCFLACVMADLVTRGKRHGVTLGVLVAGAILALAAAVIKPPVGAHMVFGQMIVVDAYAHFFRFVFLSITLITAIFSWSSREIMGRDRENQGEYYSFLAVVCFGMMIMAEANDLLTLALSIELVSLTSYILAGFARFSLRSSEASLKYVLWGALSSGFLVYGASWFYGLTGQTTFAAVGATLVDLEGADLTLLVALLFMLAGIGYKISAVPFHFWTPDVYEGSPTPITAFFAAGPKAAGFALMIRFFYVSLLQPRVDGGELVALSQLQWPWILGILSAVTMTWGNLAALRQNNVKRMLAYSSIAHVGYLLMGFVLLTEAGLSAILFYLLVYALMNLGAFLVVIALNNRLDGENIDDYAGLGFREPVVAGAMMLFLFSLTGLPPTAGFIGKFYLFAAAVQSNLWWLALFGVINSVISLYYYMRIARAMYVVESSDRGALGLARAHVVMVLVLAVPTLVLGLYWGPLKAIADTSLSGMWGG